MSRLSVLSCLVLAVAVSASNLCAQDDAFKKVEPLLDSVRLVEGHIFAPSVYAKAVEKFEQARRSQDAKMRASIVEKYLAEAEEYAQNALKAAEVAKLTMAEYTEPRNKAKTAKAPTLVPALYEAAETQFIKGAKKVESGDVKGGLAEAAKAVPFFDQAELEAIKVDIMGGADALIATAVVDEAVKFAPSTLDKAKSARSRCDAILTTDRYERGESISEIRKAEFEARHASNVARSVRSLARNDQAWEKLIQEYEIQMNRVGGVVGTPVLPFDEGAVAAGDTLIAHIKSLQSLGQETGDLNKTLGDRLSATLNRIESTDSGLDPMQVAERLDGAVQRLLEEKGRLSDNLTQAQSQFSQLRQDHDQVAAELEARNAMEEKLKKAKAVLNPSEGEVLFNASNDLVLRLSGLSFAVGKSDIQDEHIPLLEKVKSIIEMFPESKLTVEGHTDASGDLAGNMTLSEKRAYAVMQYLRQSLLISADRISAIGYGSDKPVAPNETAEGRAKNRRIDVIIMH